jgi:hypothetical protein
MVQQKPWELLQLGDVIVYQSRVQGLVCHAIVSISSKKTWVICKGWANQVADEEMVTKEKYRGCVIGQIKRPEELIWIDKRVEVGQR